MHIDKDNPHRTYHSWGSVAYWKYAATENLVTASGINDPAWFEREVILSGGYPTFKFKREENYQFERLIAGLDHVHNQGILAGKAEVRKALGI